MGSRYSFITLTSSTSIWVFFKMEIFFSVFKKIRVHTAFFSKSRFRLPVFVWTKGQNREKYLLFKNIWRCVDRALDHWNMCFFRKYSTIYLVLLEMVGYWKSPLILTGWWVWPTHTGVASLTVELYLKTKVMVWLTWSINNCN